MQMSYFIWCLLEENQVLQKGPIWKYKYVSLATLPIFLSGGIEALFVLHQVQQSRVTDLDTVFTGHQHIVRTKASVNAVLKVNK